MILGIDTETRGLDCTKFISGCTIKENGMSEIFLDKTKMWEYILELGKKQARRGKCLKVYGHNHTYDFYAYADLKDTHIRWFCERPFILAYTVSKKELEEITGKPQKAGKEIIKFLDSWAIFKMPLSKLGERINLPKLETPEELYDNLGEEEINDETLSRILSYNYRDTEIVVKSMLDLKRRLRENQIFIKRMYTINQIAINYLMNYLRKNNKADMFWNIKSSEMRRTFRANEIHSAYRGGRVECFKTGMVDKVSYVDCNSLYPYSATLIRFPDLKTEKKIWKPLQQYKLKQIIEKIGVSRVLIRTNKKGLALLPVRTKNGNYYPKNNKKIIGTYTHLELREAVKNGYEIIDIEWSVIYEDASENPLKHYMRKLYKLRKEGDDVDNYFYKMMMNACLGKLAQRRKMTVTFLDSVEKAKEYLENNHKILKGINLNYLYKKESENTYKTKYYCPIIPTLVNAMARVVMYRIMKEIPKKHLVYTDTDSIMYTGNQLDKVKISEKLGDFKIEHTEEDVIIYGRKTYCIGENMKIAGITRRNITKEQFYKGEVSSLKMVTMKTTADIDKVGTFTEEKRDLNEQIMNHREQEELLDDNEIYIDDDIEEINYFLSRCITIA